MSITNFLAQRNVTAAFPSTLPDNTVQVSAAAIIDNTTFGLYWNALSDATNRNWAGIACSANGQYITGVVNGGSIYYSNNYTVTMTASASAGTTAANWSAVAMSASGQYQIATINSGSIYYSSNYGVTWAASATVGTTAVAWSAVAMSASGTYATAVVNGGQIWYSTNYGQTWTAIPTSAGPSSITLAWSAIAISASGQYQVAVINGGSVYYSSTFGFSWTASTTPGTTAVAWTAVAISASGQYVTAGISSAALWTSTNYGQTWTVTSLTGFLWKAIAMVSSAQYQLAVGTSSMYYSNNFGSTWTTTGGTYTIRCLAASTAGHYLFAGVYGGVVYQSVTRSPSIFTSGSIFGTGSIIAGGASITGAAAYPLTGTATQMYVNDSANPLMNLLIGSRYVGTTTSYGSIQASLSNTGPQMLVLNAAGGNVGIGMTNPSYKFDVNGDAHALTILAGTAYGGSTYGGGTGYIIAPDSGGAIGGNAASYGSVTNHGTNLIIKSGNLSTQVWNNHNRAGDLIIAAGDANDYGNNGTVWATYSGGNIYINSGRAACVNAAGNASGAYSGSIIFQIGTAVKNGGGSLGGYTEAMRITTAGQVGIGTVSPTAVLEAWGAIYAKCNYQKLGAFMKGYVYPGYVGGASFGVVDSVGGAEIPILYLTDSGNVGIGATSPGYKLEVNGTTRLGGDVSTGNISTGTITAVGSTNINTPAYFNFHNSGGGYIGTHVVNTQLSLGAYGPWIRGVQAGGYTDNIRLDFCTNVAVNNSGLAIRMSILSGTAGGYIGINTTAPTYTLDVNGSTRVNSLSIKYTSFNQDTYQHESFNAVAINGNVLSFPWPQKGGATFLIRIDGVNGGIVNSTSLACVVFQSNSNPLVTWIAQKGDYTFGISADGSYFYVNVQHPNLNWRVTYLPLFG